MVDKNAAVSRLTEIIEKGRVSAMAGVQAIQAEHEKRKDWMVRPSAMKVEVEVVPGKGLQFFPVMNDRPLQLTPHSRSQLLERAAIPGTFADRLLTLGQADLLRDNFAKLIPAVSKDGIMVREIDGLAKGILSSSYRRLDASPLIEGYAEKSIQLGMLPYAGALSDTRAFLSFIRPEILEIAPGEFVVLGTEFRASDYGRGAVELSLMVLRVICSNGMIGSSMMRQVHLGGRIDQSRGEGPVFELSAKTMELDARTVRSAMTDVIGGLGKQLRAAESTLRDRVGKELDATKALAGLRTKGFRKELIERVQTMYDSDLPVELAPETRGAWRFANVLSALANTSKATDEAADLRDAAWSFLLPERLAA
jgi:hypothetical protein